MKITMLSGVILLLGGLSALASFVQTDVARYVAFIALAMGALGAAFSFGTEIRQLNRDLQLPLRRERCRLLSSLTMPRSAQETWYVDTPEGRRYMQNMTSRSGEGLRGTWLLLTYTRNSLLVLEVDTFPPDVPTTV